MATNDYIVLENSDASLSKRFKIVQGGYITRIEKKQQIKQTIGGKVTVSEGGAYPSYSYIAKVYHTVSDSNYGTKDDLEAFFLLRNPNGSPSNVITLTDHYGNTHQVYMVGTWDEQPVTTIIEGVHAFWYMQVNLVETEAVS